ncbi:MAG: amidohydrolase family protein [Candidatus Hodarchaeales archaeon]|jgi:predicted TIM-barrel fold metal-dependent hydrolase
MFTVSNPLVNIENNHSYRIFDSHVHIWGHRYLNEYLENIKKFRVERLLAIGGWDLKRNLESKGIITNNIVFCNYLSSSDFFKFKVQKLQKQIDKAHTNEIRVLKMFVGPMFQRFTRDKNPFKINDQRLETVYSLIDDYNMTVLVHVADPDISYLKKYGNTQKYGLKEDRINDFSNLLERFPKIPFVSAHLGCLPENLTRLGELLDNHPQLFVDTASTRWMIRELGRDVKQSKNWFEKYQERILFGSDLGNFEFNPKFFLSKHRREYYWRSRYWSQRLFWETSHQAPLPFKDKDNPERTTINGLNLSKSTLEKMYYKNAEELLW